MRTRFSSVLGQTRMYDQNDTKLLKNFTHVKQILTICYDFVMLCCLAFRFYHV